MGVDLKMEGGGGGSPFQSIFSATKDAFENGCL